MKFYSRFLIFVALLTAGLFISSPSAFASTADKGYFGITGTEAGVPNLLTNLDVNSVYTWTQGGGAPNTSGYTTFLTLRLGYYWWNHNSQNFFTLASPDPTGCNKSFTVPSNGQTVWYNECTIDARINTLFNSANQQTVQYFVLGNEPNIRSDNDSDGSLPSGWDNTNSNTTLLAQYQAKQYEILFNRLTIFKQSHPSYTIKVVGPSILGFSSAMNNGVSWFNAFRTAYGSNPPMDYLNYHAYDTALIGSPNYVRRMSVTDVASDLSYFRTEMNNDGYSGKEIFITEFGIPNCSVSACSLNSESASQTYLDGLINHFRANKSTLLLKGWMLFSLRKPQNPTPVVYPINSVNLTDSNGNITTTGTWYKKKIAQEFWDVSPTHLFFDPIQKLVTTKAALDGSTISGCEGVGSTGLKKYCDSLIIIRQEMAKFHIVAMKENISTNPNSFTDVGCTSGPQCGDIIFSKYIEKMKSRGITVGCGAGVFCPMDQVSRGAMITFIARSFNVDFANYTPPATKSFEDVNPGTTYYKAVEFAKSRGITNGKNGGCGYPQGTLVFCPGDMVRRDEMAAFLMNAYPLTVSYFQQ